MAIIDWNGGQRITLKNGDTARCTTLKRGQIYGIFLYNSAQNDKDTPVTVVWSNAAPPVSITVPGTTANQGLASIGLVSGDDTTTVSVSIQNVDAASIDCWLGSREMPTNTKGLDNQSLPADGKAHAYNKYRRYYAVPASSWYQLTIESTIRQFVSAQFQANYATIFVVNPTMNPDARVTPMGSVTSANYKIKLPDSTPQRITDYVQGNGTQFVWMNADSEQDSQTASIALQSLAALYE